jgi:hypothetical protein
MSENKERDAFEAWAAPRGYEVGHKGQITGDYIGGATSIAWEAWQAAIASVLRERDLAALMNPKLLRRLAAQPAADAPSDMGQDDISQDCPHDTCDHAACQCAAPARDGRQEIESAYQRDFEKVCRAVKFNAETFPELENMSPTGAIGWLVVELAARHEKFADRQGVALSDALSAIQNPYKGKDDAAAHAYDCAMADAHRIVRASSSRAEVEGGNFEIRVDGVMMAATSGPREVALKEAQRYFDQYIDEGDVVELVEVIQLAAAEAPKEGN